MKIDILPYNGMTGRDLDFSAQELYAANHTKNHASHKLNHAPLRIDAPFSEFVIPYYLTHANNVFLVIHCGPEGIKKAEQDANDCKNFGYCPSLCLPESDDYKNYWWPVTDLTIVLNWGYKDTDLQIQFANHLTHVCKARCVFTLINGVSTKFMDTSKLRVTNRIAA